MYALNFEYDGKYLSDYGYIICDFNSPSGANIVTAGSKITFNTIQKKQGKTHSLTNTTYNERLQITFNICKNPDINEDMEISERELRDLMRWLNRREFLRFRVIDDEKHDEPCYYYGSFNIQKVKIAEILYGLELTLETNSPFGYGRPRMTKLSFTQQDVNDKVQKVVLDMSDEIGYTYPKMIIKVLADGNLSVKNHSIYGEDSEPKTTTVYNCINGEIITIDNENQIITSNYDSPTANENGIYHDICNDFEYKFFALANNIKDRVNKISVSLPCKIEISYEPIIKNSPN